MKTDNFVETVSKRLLQMRRGLFIALGVLFVTLGLLGILIPVLPTTPFLLLAAYFFARSSERALHWLLQHRWFGRYIRNYREGRGMTARHKAVTITLLWLGIAASIAFAVDALWLRLLLVAIASGVTFHLLRIATCPPEPRGPAVKGSAEAD